jgi:phage shock protein B
MPVQLFVLLIIVLTVVVPTIIGFHYITKWKSLKGLSDEEQKTLEDLWQDSQRMESRINALETILDDEAPDWRRRL